MNTNRKIIFNILKLFLTCSFAIWITVRFCRYPEFTQKYQYWNLLSNLVLLAAIILYGALAKKASLNIQVMSFTYILTLLLIVTETSILPFCFEPYNTNMGFKIALLTINIALFIPSCLRSYRRFTKSTVTVTLSVASICYLSISTFYFLSIFYAFDYVLFNLQEIISIYK